MTLKLYLWGIKIATLITLIAWVLVVRQVDPEKTGAVGQFLFFTSTFLFLCGMFILFFTWLREKTLSEDDVDFSHLGVSFRQGTLMSLLVILLLILQQYRILTWWDGALTVAGILLIELYFLTKK